MSLTVVNAEELVTARLLLPLLDIAVFRLDSAVLAVVVTLDAVLTAVYKFVSVV